MSTKIEYRTLACALTDDEVAKKADELAAALESKSKIDMERKAAADGFKTKLEDVTGTISELAHQVRKHEEMRSIACHWTRDGARSMMVCSREDTGAVVEQRTMRNEERQQPLAVVEDFEEQKAKRKGKKAAENVNPVTE